MQNISLIVYLGVWLVAAVPMLKAQPDTIITPANVSLPIPTNLNRFHLSLSANLLLQ